MITELTSYITSDPSYFMGNTRLISFMMTCCLTSQLMVFLSIHIQYEELNKTSVILEFMNSLKTKTLDIKLSAKNQRKFGLRVNLLTEYALKVLFFSLSILVSSMFVSCTIYAYFDPNTGYSLIIYYFLVNSIRILGHIFLLISFQFLNTHLVFNDTFLKL